MVGDTMKTRYSTILADPPWPYDSPRAIVGNAGRGSQGGRAAEMTQVDVTDHYPTMSIPEIKALPVLSRVEDNAHLYLWVTNAFLVEAHDIARAWGFNPKTLITWVKVKADGTPSMKTGYYYRGATEHMLFCVRGSMRLEGPPAPTAFMSLRLPHSVKPEWAYELIEQQSPYPVLELFARRDRVGWDAWGNELSTSIEL